MLVVIEPHSPNSLANVLFVPSSPVPQQSKRLSTPAIALRSKSMTSELEEMGKKLALTNFWGCKKKHADREMLINKKNALKFKRRKNKLVGENRRR